MNELEITFRTRKVVEEPDRRYRILVMLQRSDRPKYWNFHCPNCKTKVVEFQNYDLYAMTDFYDPQSLSNASVALRCDGPHCRYYYFFVLS